MKFLLVLVVDVSLLGLVIRGKKVTSSFSYKIEDSWFYKLVWCCGELEIKLTFFISGGASWEQLMIMEADMILSVVKGGKL